MKLGNPAHRGSAKTIKPVQTYLFLLLDALHLWRIILPIQEPHKRVILSSSLQLCSVHNLATSTGLVRCIQTLVGCSQTNAYKTLTQHQTNKGNYLWRILRDIDNCVCDNECPRGLVVECSLQRHNRMMKGGFSFHLICSREPATTPSHSKPIGEENCLQDMYLTVWCNPNVLRQRGVLKLISPWKIWSAIVERLGTKNAQ